MATEASGDRQQSSPTENSAPSSSKERRRFNLKDELSDVRELMDGSDPANDRLDSLHKHYMTLVRDYKRMEKRLTESHRKQMEVAQHRDIIQGEVNRVTTAKAKLESLCRELQKHNKQVIEESRVRAREEEEKRQEVAERFQSTIDDVTMRMQEHHQKNIELKEENAELLSKLKKLLEQYEQREKHFEELLKHKQLELQLSEAKFAQQMVALAENKESSMAERQFLLVERLQQQKRIEEMTQNEVELRGQLNLYSEKFEEFQKTLNKSNEVFASFKKEMDKMSKTITQLEKESGMWKTRYEKCNRNLLEMAEERIKHDETIQTYKGKNEKLEKLCRALQMERTQLNQKLKDLQIEESGKLPNEAPTTNGPATPPEGTEETDKSDKSSVTNEQ